MLAVPRGPASGTAIQARARCDRATLTSTPADRDGRCPVRITIAPGSGLACRGDFSLRSALTTPAGQIAAAGAAGDPLVQPLAARPSALSVSLRRDLIDAAGFACWLSQATRRGAPNGSRELIQLLAEDHSGLLPGWILTNARPSTWSR